MVFKCFSAMKILIATKNKGKMAEIRQIFRGTKYEVLFLSDIKELEDVEIHENAKSCEGNALIKAIICGEKSGMVTLGDDSGLFVDALGGEPGINSARYSGGGDKENIAKLLRVMADVPEERRDSHYECRVAIYDPKTTWVETVEGRWDGRVAFEPRGTKSFGYAPIFLSKDYDYKLTNAELDKGKTLKVNHRGEAFRKAIEMMDRRFD